MDNSSENIQVSILILPESSMMSLSSVIDPLRAANRLSRKPLFSWNLLSLTGDAIELTCGIKIEVDRKLQKTEMGELFIVIGGFNQDQHCANKSLALIRKVSNSFNTISAVESGTWVLARAGVIHNHRVTTHWEDLENFAFAYPNLDVVGERFVIDRHIWTSGGASPSLDMLLHYLRITQHKSLALDVAKVFIYNESKASSDVQANASLARLRQIDSRLSDAIEIMQNNIEQPYSINAIAAQLDVSQRTLELITNQHLGLSPAAHYLRLRLQTARKLVLDTNSAMCDIAVRCGFNSQSAFSRAFSRHYRQSPSQLRQQSKQFS